MSKSPELHHNDRSSVSVVGHIKIYDPQTNEVFIDKKNAIHYENISIAMAQTLSDRNTGYIYQMAFGNGGSSVDPTGVITYLPPNTIGQNADLLIVRNWMCFNKEKKKWKHGCGG